MELEAAKVADRLKLRLKMSQFKTKEMATAFREIASAMARFQKMDPNSSRFLKVNRGIDDAMACFREIYEEKKKAIVQSSLDKFVRKAERHAPSTSPQPSTSFSEPE
jgi:hypothetical protein